MQIVFLGTGGSVPTTKRSLASFLIKREDEQLMFDCGEGVQRQMIKARGGFHKKMKIFITHMHGDHVLGLPGLLQTMSLLDRSKKLDVYGPPGTKAFLECVKGTVQFVLTFPIEIHEIEKAGTICDEREYTVQAIWADHVIPSLAFAFAEKDRPGRFHPEKAKALGVPEGPAWSRLQQGIRLRLPDGRTVKPEQVMGKHRAGRKVVYTGDTRPFKELVRFTAGADVLVHDATLDDELSDRAEEDGHSTPAQAAECAKKANVKQLILTHISARYKDTHRLLEQARKTFKKTAVAEDFMTVELPLPKK